MRFLMKMIATLLSFGLLYSQELPPERIFDWSEAGYSGEIPTPLNILNVIDFGADNTGLSDSGNSVNDAINSLNGQSGVVFFPSGEYFFTDTLVIPDSVVVRGEGPELTILNFDLDNQTQDCILVSRIDFGPLLQVNSGSEIHSDQLVLNNPAYFNVGDYVEIFQENDPGWNIGNESWAAYSVGHITRVVAVEGNTVTISEPLRIDFEDHLNPRIRRINPVEQVGIEKLRINRLDNPTGLVFNISFNYAANSWVRGIYSYRCAGGHIGVTSGYKIEIAGNYIYRSHSYSGGGRGYGIVLQRRSSYNLVQDNILRRLRHAIVLQTGANGNVVGYNYSREPYWSDQYFFIPTDYPADLCFHGNYAFSNLIEGNIVSNLYIDNSHGASGPYNAFIRNRAELYGIIMQNNHSHNQSFIGNEVTKHSGYIPPYYGQYNLSGQGHYQYGNDTRNNGMRPSETGDLPASIYSYYLDNNNPGFWIYPLDLPVIGPPNPRNSNSITARERYLHSDYFFVYPPSLGLPWFDIEPGIYQDIINLDILTEDIALLKFEEDGTEPDENSQVWPGLTEINDYMMIKVRSFKENYYPSELLIGEFVVLRPPENLEISGFEDEISLSWQPSLNIPDFSGYQGEIQYKIFRKSPHESAFSEIETTTETVFIDIGLEPGNYEYYLKLYFEGVESLASPTVSEELLQVEPVFISPDPDFTYFEPIEIELFTNTENAYIYYTTDGSLPTENSFLYYEPIFVDYNTELTVKAKAYKTGLIASDIISMTYQVTGTVSNPIFDPNGGTFQNSVEIMLSSATENVNIRYTVDSITVPNDSTGYLYCENEPLILNETALVQAVAFKDDWISSNVVNAYFIVLNELDPPFFDPEPGFYNSDINVSIYHNTPFTNIYYSVDGSIPDQYSNLYQEPIFISLGETLMIKAIAISIYGETSPVSEGIFNVFGQLSRPFANFDSGTYLDSLTVSLISFIPGVEIYYTLDGSLPNQNSNLYFEPLTLNQATNLSIRSFKQNWMPSEVRNYNYDFVKAPDFFDLETDGEIIYLSWESRELDFLQLCSNGYNVYRKLPTESEFLLLNESVVYENFFLDEIQSIGTIHYKIRAVYQGEESYSFTTNSIEIPIEMFSIGDINRDGSITPLDAASVVKYFLGLDPIPEIDPLPWSPVSKILADVDLDGDILPLDGAYILQYYVGIIESLPVEPSRSKLEDKGVVELVYESGCIYLYADEDVMGLGVELVKGNPDNFGKPVLLDEDWLCVMNITNKSISIGLASYGISSDYTPVLYLPLNSTQDLSESIEFKLFINNKPPHYISFTTQDLQQDSVLENSFFVRNYPNPFNLSTNLEFYLIEDIENVEIKIFNAKGRFVNNIFTGDLSKGRHIIEWNGRDFLGNKSVTGVYIIRIELNDEILHRKTLLLK